MSTIKIRFDGQAFIPVSPVNLPIGFVVEIPIPNVPAPAANKSSMAKLADIAHQHPPDPDTPTDLAAQVDHYLYGTPKQP